MWQDWKAEFDEVILGRGLDYYLDGKVDIVGRGKNRVDAVVNGTNSYRVKIKFFDRQGYCASCTCPYADGGGGCKHIAAVFYKLAAEASDTKTGLQSVRPHTTDSLQDLISKLSEADAKDLLLAEARKNSALCDYIRNFYGKDDINLASLKRTATNIKRRHADRHGFIDYYHASDYAADMESFMDRYINSMLRKHDYKTAFELVCHIYYCLGKLAIDDSNGEITSLADTCLSYWQEIVEASSLDEQWIFFDWFKKHLHNYVVDYLQCWIDDFFIDSFHDPDMLRQKLTVLDCLITKTETEPDDGFSSLRYDLEKYVLARIHVMSELDMPSNEIDIVCQTYYRLPGVRQFILKELIKNGEKEQAIKLLEESKQIDHKWPGLTAKACEQLMELYQQTGQKQFYRQELEEYIFNYRQDDLKYIQLLKSLCNQDEWQKKLKELLSAPTLCNVKSELMIQEGLHRQLLDNIHKSVEQWHYDAHAVSTLDYYEEILSAEDPEAVRDLYADFVRKNSEYTNGRPQYQMLVNYLRKIEAYPLGKDLVEQIVAEWRTRYPRRIAMMEELKRAGF